MGIVNITADSFSDGGRFLATSDAIVHGRALIAAGADVIDVGGESTRPGADPVSTDLEIERVVPVVEALAGEITVSIDTTKPEVARAAVAAGAGVLNDVSASLHELAAELGVGWIAMHRRGDPKTMQLETSYDDVVAEVCAALDEAARAGVAAGVPRIWVDPGIGFGKGRAENIALLAHLDELMALGHPLVIGVSRKQFIGKIHADSDRVEGVVAADDRLEGSLALATWALARGVDMVRVHDVRATVQASRVVAA